MRDSQKTKKQLLNEIQEVRSQFKLLAAAEVERKQAGAELKRSEEKFYKAFLSIPDMVIITSIANGKYIEVNDSFVRNTGYSREELIGHTLDEFGLFINPAEQERMMQILQKQGNLKNEEFTFRVRSGEIRRWLCSAEFINIDGEACMIAVAIDITERKKIEQALSDSEQKLAIAFRSSPQAIGISTLDDGRFIEVNDSHLRLTGYTREETIGHTALELNIWENQEERERIKRGLKEMRRVVDEELTLRTRSGEMRTVLFSAEIISIGGEECMIGSSTDLTERKKIEQALRESEEKFYKAFSSSPTALCLFSIEESTFLEINDSYTRFTGYSKEEIIGHTPEELNLWVSQNEKDKMAKSLRETGTLVNERIRSRMKSGEVRTGLFSAQTIDISGEKRLILTVTDITGQVKAEEAMANEATLRRILIHYSRDGIVILDVDGKVFEANRRFAEMLGYSPEEASRLYVWDWDTQWDRENLIGQIRKVDETGDHFETFHKRKDGTIINVEISTNGATIAGKKLVFCICRDITKRTQMEKALRESEEKFSKAFHASPEITAITTIKDGKYIDINENYTRLTGYTREELIGRTTNDVNIWGNKADRDDMLETLKKQGRISNKEYCFRNKAGGIRTWQFSAEQVTIGGEPCLLGVSIDITDRKRLEAQALEAENLREVDRLRRELLSNVSHELRTPLASIKGFATMLMDYGKKLKPDEKQDYLDTIDKNADRLVELIEQLLEMSRLGAGMVSIRKVPANVIILCQSVIKEAQARAPDHVFILDVPRKLPRIEIDDRRIRQALENIIDNSVKYSQADTEIALSVRKNGDNLLFVITDHGSGISKEDLLHIFDRMFISRRRKAGVTGAGLGLSICKGLIEAHGGKIWLESDEGTGTRCFFTLPIKPKPSAVTEDEAVEAVSPVKSSTGTG